MSEVQCECFGELYCGLCNGTGLKSASAGRRPTTEEKNAWNCAEDERDWWRAYALELEAQLAALQSETKRPLGERS